MAFDIHNNSYKHTVYNLNSLYHERFCNNDIFAIGVC